MVHLELMLQFVDLNRFDLCSIPFNWM